MQVTVRDTGDLRAVAKAIRKHANAKQLRAELAKGMRAEIKPIVRAAKAGYSGGRHLRPALRRATRGEVKLSGRSAGARIRVDGRRMPPGMGSLPAMYEGDKRWRHPVFGNRDAWVTQRARPTFYRIVRTRSILVRRRIEDIVEDIARRIAKD